MSWDNVSQNSIHNCWKKANLVAWTGAASEFEDDEIRFNLPAGVDTIQRWLNCDANLEIGPPDTDEEIVNEVTGKSQEISSSSDDNDDDDIEDIQPVSNEDVKI